MVKDGVAIQKELYQVRALNIVSAMISVSGIIFQLLLAANMSYLLGNALVQYSLTIGIFLSGMGIGSHLSRYVDEKFLFTRFIVIQLTIAVLGGTSSFLLFTFFAYTNWYQPMALLLTLLIGANIGYEVPILVRMVTGILKSLKDGAAGILAWDYAGSLLGSLLVPFILVPFLGYVRGAFLIGLINWGAAAYIFFRFQKRVFYKKVLSLFGLGALLLLITGLAYGDQTAYQMEQKLYKDRIIRSFDTGYQRITVTKNRDDIRLYLNGNLQFSSFDEYRYHEALVHVPAGLTVSRYNVLILGGGDGLAVRELLKYPDVKHIKLVDLDRKMVDFARRDPLVNVLNRHSLDNPRVETVYQDAFKFLEQDHGQYGLILVDLPDPDNESLNKLYTLEFYNLVQRHLLPGGYVSIQSTSPLFAREVFWTVVNTVQKTGLNVLPYHLEVPSFGNWGYTLASNRPINKDRLKITVQTRYLNQEILPSLFRFAQDERFNTDQVNTLLKPVLLPMYDRAWKGY